MPVAKLPPELLHLIVDEVKSPSDLYNLSLTSRGLNHWAERALYCTIDFDGVTDDGNAFTHLKAISAASQIIAYPHLGLHVHYISFWLALPTQSPFPPSLFFQALRNLKSLSIWLYGDNLCAIEPNVPFQLRSFVCLGCDFNVSNSIGPKLVAFLNSQVDLEHVELWDKPILTSDTLLSPQALPKLNALWVHHADIRALLPGRNVKRLSMFDAPDTNNQLIMGVSKIESLSVRGTTTLRLYRQCFSVLRFLEFVVASHFEGNGIPMCLGDLDVLEKLRLHVKRFSERRIDYNSDIEGAVWIPTFTARCFLACPSLQRIEIQDHIWHEDSHMWIRNVEAPLVTKWNPREWLLETD